MRNKTWIILFVLLVGASAAWGQENETATEFDQFSAQFKEIQSYSAVLAHNPFLALFGIGLALHEDKDSFPLFHRVPFIDSWFVLIPLGLLALIAIFSDFEPTTGTLQQWLSDNIGTILAILVPLIALVGEAANEHSNSPAVVQAGFFGDLVIETKYIVLAVVSVVNFYVIASVRFAFSVVVSFFSPMPWMSGICSLLRSLVAGGLIFLYSWQPWLAIVINILIFLFALLVFRWAYRVGRYVKQVILEPVVHKLFHKKQPYELVARKLPLRGMKRVGLATDGLELALPVFVLKYPKISKRTKIWLLKWADREQVILMIPRRIRKPRVFSWPVEGETSFLGNALLSLEIFTRDKHFMRSKFAVTRGFVPFKDKLHHLIEAQDYVDVGVKKTLKELEEQTQNLIDGAQDALKKAAAAVSEKVKSPEKT
ncbi:MAG TPA: hypothetical protein PKW95_09470 [bacterium]|nr:hypothetical protein [bacterium]